MEITKVASMGNRRRKDDAHDIGDSAPGTVGESQGTIHDGQDGPTFEPDDVTVPSGSTKQSDQHHTNSNNTEAKSDSEDEEAESQSTRMEYAKRYGDSWPEDRQRRFLREHDVSAKEMGWTLTE
jgi:hypothetical protein